MSGFIEQWRDCSATVEAHTSGSTGAPKAIKLLKADMIISAEATNRFFDIDGGSLLGCPLSESYIAGKMMVVRAEISGAELVCESPGRTPFAMTLGRVIDLVAIVPQQIEGLLKSPNRFRHIIVGGGPVSPVEEAMALDHSRLTGAQWWMTYGMTETCSHVALRRFGSECYECLPGITVSVDSRGCLVISSEKSSWGRVVTNDLAELHSPTSFRWLGRIDNVVISGGKKLHPELIEPQIAPIVGTIPFFLTGRESERWGEELVMVMEGELSDREVESLFDKIRDALGHDTAPKAIIQKKQLPRTYSGKLIREI
ncbi:MAG: AMP-binding protein [Paramuribaculum sp.]|nr:AMP-binding protein [Paramuribaculum sp.]MDE6303768.1 AMP-binding protein [Paramuribaculum sp.]